MYARRPDEDTILTIPYNYIHSRLTRVAAANRPVELKALLNPPNAPPLAATDVNWREREFGNTALHWAVANSNTRIALLLLDLASERIDFNRREYKGKTALHLALGKGYEHFTNDLSQGTEEPCQAPVIHRLVVEMAKRKLLNVQDDLGNTPLHIAMLRRDYFAIELLLNHGATLDAPTNLNGVTPRDLLNSCTYAEAMRTIDSYVHVFTLPEDTWTSNLASVRDDLLSHYPLETTDAKDDRQLAFSVAVPVATPASSPTSITPSPTNAPLPLNTATVVTAEVKKEPSSLIEINAPVEIIFEQAIAYLDGLTGLHKTDSLITPQMTKSAVDFQAALRKLKNNISHLSEPEQRILAKEAINLSMKTASLAIDKQDIQEFHQATVTYRKSSKLGKIIGAVIGAVLGVFVGTLVGMVSGPGAAFTALAAGAQGAVIGACVGGIFGTGVGFWATKKILEQKHSLTQIQRAASKIARELKPGS